MMLSVPQYDPNAPRSRSKLYRSRDYGNSKRAAAQLSPDMGSLTIAELLASLRA